MSTFRALELSKPVQELVVLVIVADPEAPVTVETFDPCVAHPAALSVIAVDSALPPLVVSGGEKVNDPMMLVQTTPPVASVWAVVVGPALGLEPELHAARVATKPRGRTSVNRKVCNMDIDRSPGTPDSAPYPSQSPRR
jgi:hypothetical protein